MNARNNAIFRFIAGAVALIGLPVLGVWLAGYDLSRYFAFPPRSLYVQHAPFSIIIFVLLVAIEAAAIFLAIRAGCRGHGQPKNHPAGTFPWWGWLGIVWLTAWWTLAWNRFAWFAPLQVHTFTPLWLGYIIIINALTFRKSGRCLLTHDTGYLLKLFPLSAAFWWFFEYLNRFVQNWTYEGVDHMGATSYFFFATLAFSTVLPAVMSTNELLDAYDVAHRADDRQPPLPRSYYRFALFAVSLLALLFLGIVPDFLFPTLWLAPLGLVVFVQPLEHFPRIFPTIGTFLRLSLAALVCGFFWELWNIHSYAKWVYHVPFVQILHVFEMPLLGYFGYLPFGWECAWIAGMVRRRV